MKKQWIVLELRSEVVLDVADKAKDRIAEACCDNLAAGLQDVGVLCVDPKEHCELCGRAISIYNLAWYLQRDDGFVFNCVDVGACLEVRRANP